MADDTQYGLCPHCGYYHDLINKKTVCYRLRHPTEDVDGFPNAWNTPNWDEHG